MRGIFSNKFNNIFSSGILAVLLVFLYVRPLNSPWHPFIAGDGLGYYAYLPAKFIHNDPDLDFKWFNRVYNKNYVYSTFDNPEDNLLVKYGDKRINKYYQGLSFIWMPFFIGAHIFAKLFHFEPDGFSFPYQVFIGFASLFYLVAGLYYLRRLLAGLFKNQYVAAIVPFLFFFGTHLYTYAIFANTLSHAYSFSFFAGFLYFVWRFFNEPRCKLQSLLVALVLLIIAACIRPLNVLIVLTVPAFMPPGFLKSRPVFEKFRLQHALLILVTLGAISYQLWITHIQTGSFLAYTYTDEKFNFRETRFIDALFSYHLGIFVYVPIIFLSLFGLVYLRKRMAIILGFLFFLAIYIYSSWWYWPIVKRAMIDFYPIPAIFLGALLAKPVRRSRKILWLAIAFVSVIYFQFKNLQVNRGVLDEYLTYKEVFWKNFFSLKKMNQFFIPPKSILHKKEFVEDFEDQNYPCKRTSSQRAGGENSLLLDRTDFICTVSSCAFPTIFNEPGRKKIRISFDILMEENLSQVHIFLKFINTAGQPILEAPFYLKDDFIHPGEWEHKEFGYDIADDKVLSTITVSKVEVIIWNVAARTNVYVDNATLEFFVTDTSFETIK